MNCAAALRTSNAPAAPAINAPETLRSKVPAAPRESSGFQRGLVAAAGRGSAATAIPQAEEVAVPLHELFKALYPNTII